MEHITSDNIFAQPERFAPLKLIALKSATKLGDEINGHLMDMADKANFETDGFLIESECPRFASGDAKGVIKESIRGDDLYILVDVGNYSCKYKSFGMEHNMSADDHYQDLKRIISAAGGKACRVNVIMPMLYGGRQHRRTFRESLDCALALQELQNMGVSNIITFDAHDPRVVNAVPLMGFDNVMPYYQVLKCLFKKVEGFTPKKDKLMVVSPDEGAMNRNIFYASMLGTKLGVFYKRRDFSKVVGGRNPIVAHEYLGEDVEGMDIFISDDMISSGESLFDVATELKKRKANRIFSFVTYGIFTNGLEKFDKAYEEGLLDGVLCTNLTYASEELKSKKWYHEVNCSKYIAYIIAAINHNTSVGDLLDPHDKIVQLLDECGWNK